MVAFLVDDAVADWLLEGDPAIRWQVMRDLLDEPPAVWMKERARTLEHGWVAELLARRAPDGEWPAGRWTGTTWTLLLLIACGAPELHPAARPALSALVDRFIPPDRDVDGAALLPVEHAARISRSPQPKHVISASLLGLLVYPP